MKKQMIVLAMTVALLLLTVPAVFAEVAPPATEETTTEVTQETVNATSQGTASATMADSQKLDASYTLALNAINKEDYTGRSGFGQDCGVTQVCLTQSAEKGKYSPIRRR